MLRKPSITLLFITAALQPLAHASVLAATDFDSAQKSAQSQAVTNVVWTTHPLVTASATINCTANSNAGFFDNAATKGLFSPDQNLDLEGPWTAHFSITIAEGEDVNLTDITFHWKSFSNSGDGQNRPFDETPYQIEATVNGSSYGSVFTINTVSGNTGKLAEARVLPACTHAITITARGSTSEGNNLAIDHLSLNGSAHNGNFRSSQRSAALIKIGGISVNIPPQQ